MDAKRVEIKVVCWGGGEGGMKGRFCKVLLGLLDWVGKIFVKGKEKIVLNMVMHFEMILAYSVSNC